MEKCSLDLAQLLLPALTKLSVPNSAGQACTASSLKQFKECGKTGLPNLQWRSRVRSCESTHAREATWLSHCWSLSRECWQSVPIVFTADQTTKWTRTGTAAVGQSSQAKQGCYSNHTDITGNLMIPWTHCCILWWNACGTLTVAPTARPLNVFNFLFTLYYIFIFIFSFIYIISYILYYICFY